MDRDWRMTVIFCKNGKPKAANPVLVFEESEKIPALAKLPKPEGK
jgi:hypothetical protein